jgi:hypothetical protein
MKILTNEDQFPCEKCSKICRSHHGLKQHKKVCEEKENDFFGFLCEICSQGFKSTRGRDLHKTTCLKKWVKNHKDLNLNDSFLLDQNEKTDFLSDDTNEVLKQARLEKLKSCFKTVKEIQNENGFVSAQDDFQSRLLKAEIYFCKTQI